MIVLIRAVFIVLILIISEISSLSQVYWIRKQSPVTTWLYKCSFADTLNGWACGESGTIIHTSNGGESWNLQYSHEDYYLEGICFVNSRIGWCIGNDYAHLRSIIFNTTNGGSYWNVYPYPDTTLILNAIYFLDSLNGYLGGYEGTIIKTTNAGDVWKVITVDSSAYFSYPIKSFRFFNSRIGVACGGANEWGGVLWKTTNYGNNWIAFSIGPEPVYDVVYLDSLNAYAAGGDPELGVSFSVTRNNWVDYEYNFLGYLGIGQRVAMRTTNELWIPLSFSQSWVVSTDAGNQWRLINNNDSDVVYDAVFTDSTHGWAVGAFGRVFKYNAEIIGIKNYGKGCPETYQLFQNFPNPFNPVTKIKFSIPHISGFKGVTNLTIYNALGREVSVLLNKQLIPGTYEADWDGTNFPSGVYFCRLSAGNYSQTKKMVLIK